MIAPKAVLQDYRLSGVKISSSWQNPNPAEACSVSQPTVDRLLVKTDVAGQISFSNRITSRNRIGGRRLYAVKRCCADSQRLSPRHEPTIPRYLAYPRQLIAGVKSPKLPSRHSPSMSPRVPDHARPSNDVFGRDGTVM